ncbi:C-type lectin domain family 9 member A-like [Macrosteles quadrilineatus]|uniref:C-type lectin domain family 9 member A-like n=1 Tax=Macrosteles quadrilineatus TaxID=74068 RepID=UPI0023E0CF58|nr:C-type lectin domain family 9 member A-like [Macrosteles quadrilineatus]
MKTRGVVLLMLIVAFAANVEADDPVEGDEDGGSSLDLPGIPSLIEQLALREEKVMKQLSTQMLPPPLGYVVNKPEPDYDRVERPLNRPPVSGSSNKEVTETDLYLLGAIERLVYRVDLMEKRLKRSEELLYHVMQGANTQREDPCPGNFTRVARNCYHISERQFNWKSAASMCKSLGANLVELESREEFTELVTFLQADPYLQGTEFWTGGLNPGLLWIWSNTGRPVTPKRPTTRPEDTVVGAGRCLSLGYSPKTRLFQYQGAECGVRQRYICEHEENATSRGLNRIHKALQL